MAPKRNFLITYQAQKKAPDGTCKDALLTSTQGLHHRRVTSTIRHGRLLGPYHKPVVGVPADPRGGMAVSYDLGGLGLGTNNRSHRSEGKKMCKATLPVHS